MQYANITTKYICPIDLHFDTMYISIMDRAGNILKQKNLPATETAFKKWVAEYQSELTVACESVPNYYWLKDMCDKNKIEFVLGHAQYMWRMSTKKKKDDRIDSEAMGNLMNTRCYPLAYAYPAGIRELRDLLRERLRIVRLRSAAYTRLRLMSVQYGIPLPEGYSIKRKTDRRTIIERFTDNNTAMKAEINIRQIEAYDADIRQIERKFRESNQEGLQEQSKLLQSIPGMGSVLSMSILLEMHHWDRFPTVQQFSSYSRVVYCQRISNGKTVDKKHRKIGNPYLKWAFSLVAVAAIKNSASIKKLHLRLKNKHGKRKALAILRHRIAVAVYFMLKQQEPFVEELFVRSGKQKIKAF
jgi:transposase